MSRSTREMAHTKTSRKAHHLNVVGDFYVEEDCCLCCGVPQSIAPDLFASLEEHDLCFVKKQPETPDELDRMIEVMATQDLGCIRYRGKDEATVQRILEVADIDVIDGKPSKSSPTSWWRRFFGSR